MALYIEAIGAKLPRWISGSFDTCIALGTRKYQIHARHFCLQICALHPELIPADKRVVYRKRKQLFNPKLLFKL